MQRTASENGRTGKTIPDRPLIRPPRLRPGDVIGVVSPAGPVEGDALELGVKLLREMGFEVRLGAHALDRTGYLAGDDDSRLADLHAMFEDPDVRAIFCARGGYGSLRLLERIRYDVLRENPKILAGYSDLTALLLAVYGRAGLICFHAPMVREFAAGNEANLPFLLGVLTGGTGPEIRLTEAVALAPGEAEGPLLGGNLSLLCHLVGTRYLPDLSGAILFIEERGEPPYRIDRMLTHLGLSGTIDRIAGLLGGEFPECGPMDEIGGLVRDLAARLGVPAVLGLPVGHGPKNLTLPVGIRARLNTAELGLTFLEPAVRA